MIHHRGFPNLLLVENDAKNLESIQAALAQGTVPVNVHVVVDHLQTMSFLHQQGEQAGVSRPGVILLDGDTLAMNGCELLREIKADGNLWVIPVIVLSSSHAQQDITDAYGLEANSYIFRPLMFSDLRQTMQTLKSFWFDAATFPPMPRSPSCRYQHSLPGRSLPA